MNNLPRLGRAVAPSDAALLQLPEKAVQFGTGAFLRGFIEYFIDAANRKGLFGGRIVAVGSTGSGRDRVLNEQDGLYTLAMRGRQNEQVVSRYQLITSLSRALSAATEWQQVLECARNPAIELVFSNTTETGIQLDDNDVPGNPPRSFPGKLTQFLYTRACAFDYAREAGVVVLPCELIEDNGDRLKQIVLRLAELWKLDPRFAEWIEEAVPFCNTLVDRIVPGEPAAAEKESAWQELGYRDELLTATEIYGLYAIQADDVVAAKLKFTAADAGIVVANDITPYRQRKVRLLNGTHTISIPAALLAGCTTVREAVEDDAVGSFMRRALFTELVPSSPAGHADDFAREVMDRFANPFIRHELQDITLQQTMKMRVRIVPAIVDYVARAKQMPAALAFGFAAYLLVVRDGIAKRTDDGAARVRELLGLDGDAGSAARAVCSATDLWGIDLTALGFDRAVADAIQSIESQGVRAALEGMLHVVERA